MMTATKDIVLLLNTSKCRIEVVQGWTRKHHIIQLLRVTQIKVRWVLSGSWIARCPWLERTRRLPVLGVGGSGVSAYLVVIRSLRARKRGGSLMEVALRKILIVALYRVAI
jgi:hypothetical protein